MFSSLVVCFVLVLSSVVSDVAILIAVRSKPSLVMNILRIEDEIRVRMIRASVSSLSQTLS